MDARPIRLHLREGIGERMATSLGFPLHKFPCSDAARLKLSSLSLASPYCAVGRRAARPLRSNHRSPSASLVTPATAEDVAVVCTSGPSLSLASKLSVTSLPTEYSISSTQDATPRIINWRKEDPESSEDDRLVEAPGWKDVCQVINEVKARLGEMGDGEITVSAYDTAWVALVRGPNGSAGPQFPSSLQWIVENQLPDGSWGDRSVFSARDRMINTLACVIALKSWNRCPDKREKGVLFLRKNLWRLAEEEAELMPIGFEIAFPSLIEIAKALGLELPYDDPALQNIYAQRNLKLERIPKDVMHKVPTTLLHSLEGMPGLDWERLLRLQCCDGSFLFSPSATAYAFMQTGDQKCLEYLQKVVERFHGGVPNVYPVDLFEHLWVVDRLERLGVSRFFEAEIKQCLDYVYRHWTEDGICWARNSLVRDVDDTAMGFRLLRLHGYGVSPEVFRHFEKDGEFFCFAGQSNQAVTGMYNLHRASQLRFPGESILERAEGFSGRFLREKQASNQLLDKWVMTKDLPGEVDYALGFPWYASLPRVEARMYVEQYGGGGDVWIGKTLYRMPMVSADAYLELAKADFNSCQAVHQREWLALQKWYRESGLGGDAVDRRCALRAFFLAAACVFEPHRAAERLGWAWTAVLAEAVSSHLNGGSCTVEMKGASIDELRRGFDSNSGDYHIRSGGGRTGEEGLVGPLVELVERLASNARPAQQQQQARHHLRQAWGEWLLTCKREEEEVDGAHRRWGPGREETALLLVRTIEICAGRFGLTGSSMDQPEYAQLARLTSSICHRLRRRMLLLQGSTEQIAIASEDKTVEAEMQELAQCVLQSSHGLHYQTKQTFLNVAKSFYYAARCSPATLDSHISKVLFERVA